MSSLSNAKASARARIVTNTAGLPPTGRRPGSGSGWGRSGDSWTTKAGSKTKNIVQKARREAKELSVFLGRNSKLAAPTHTLKRAEVSRNLKAKIKDPVALPESVESAGKKRPVPVDDEDLEEGERGNLDDRTARWISGGGSKRVAVGKLNRTPSAGFAAVGSSSRTVNVPRKAEADPFMRKKQIGARR